MIRLISQPRVRFVMFRSLAVIAIAILGMSNRDLRAESVMMSVKANEQQPRHDRFWLVSTRDLQRSVCYANLEAPQLRLSSFDTCGRIFPTSLDQYLAERDPYRPTVIYVHGNRMRNSRLAVERSLSIYRETKGQLRCLGEYDGPLDWVVWSWPSERQGILLGDVRTKAAYTDTQGLYLAWLLRRHAESEQPTALIGYSFGGRVVTGALHALAGGSLGGRTLPGQSVTGAVFDVALVAPAIRNNWMMAGGYHRLATQNIDTLKVLYNRQDPVLKNYWRINNIRNADALGYSGPRGFAPRADGSTLPVTSRNCAPAVGRHHDEMDYYDAPCNAGRAMADLTVASLFRHE